MRPFILRLTKELKLELKDGETLKYLKVYKLFNSNSPVKFGSPLLFLLFWRSMPGISGLGSLYLGCQHLQT